MPRQTHLAELGLRGTPNVATVRVPVKGASSSKLSCRHIERAKAANATQVKIRHLDQPYSFLSPIR